MPSRGREGGAVPRKKLSAFGLTIAACLLLTALLAPSAQSHKMNVAKVRAYTKNHLTQPFGYTGPDYEYRSSISKVMTGRCTREKTKEWKGRGRRERLVTHVHGVSCYSLVVWEVDFNRPRVPCQHMFCGFSEEPQRRIWILNNSRTIYCSSRGFVNKHTRRGCSTAFVSPYPPWDGIACESSENFGNPTIKWCMREARQFLRRGPYVYDGPYY